MGKQRYEPTRESKFSEREAALLVMLMRRRSPRVAKKTKRGIVEQLMSEMVLCGGLLYTRKQLFDELLAEGFPHRSVDAFVFGYLKAVEVTPHLFKQNQTIRTAMETETQQIWDQFKEQKRRQE